MWQCLYPQDCILNLDLWTANKLQLQEGCDPPQEQNSLSHMNGATFYEQHDAPPGSHTTEPRHRAFVKGATTNWHENGAYRMIRNKYYHCVLLTCNASDICWWVTELWSELTVPCGLSSWHVVGILYHLNNALLNSYYYTNFESCLIN
jgi:hypothetical protein